VTSDEAQSREKLRAMQSGENGRTGILPETMPRSEASDLGVVGSRGLSRGKLGQQGVHDEGKVDNGAPL